MATSDPLKVLLRAVQDGWLSGQMLARLAREWEESGHPDFFRFVWEQGRLTGPQRQIWETAINLADQDSSFGAKTLELPASGSAASAPEPPTPGGSSVGATPVNLSLGHGWEAPGEVGGSRYGRKRFFRKGGPGQIWLVWDDALGRDVIVKTIQPELARKPAMLTRFLREARLTSQLEHPNIVPVYDLLAHGADQESWAYSMRYVQGPTLAEAIEKYHLKLAMGNAENLDLVRLLDSFILLCKAVAYAHSRGIIHRDLKGQNVILGDFGEVILLDWGLAKRIGEEDPERTVDFGPMPAIDQEQITVPGSINGTPAFMSPEVASGEPASVRSDIYSLGAILYTICCGRPPYRGATALETLDKVKAGPPPAPSVLQPLVPRALEAIALQAMARVPDKRYAGAEWLAEEVRRWLADEPVGAFADPWAVRALRWARKNRTKVQLTAGVLATALLGLVVGVTLIWREKEETQRQKVAAVENYRIARELSESSIGLMERSEAYYTANEELSRSRKSILDATAVAYRSFVAQEPTNPDLLKSSAKVLRYAANAHRLDDEFPKATSMYQEAINHLESCLSQNPNDLAGWSALAQTWRDWAQAGTAQGEMEQSAQRFQRGLDAYRRCMTLTSSIEGITRGMSLCRYELGEVHAELGDHETALGLEKEALSGWETLLSPKTLNPKPYDRLLRAAAWNRIARNQLELGKGKEAHDSARKAINHLEDDFGPRSTWIEGVVRGVARLDLLNHRLMFLETQVLAGQASGEIKDSLAEIQWNELIEEAKTIQAMMPDRPVQALRLATIRHGYGKHLKKSNRPIQARQQLRMALDHLSSPAIARDERISILLALGELHLDLVDLERELENEAGAVEHYQKALGHYSRVREKCPNHVDLKKLQSRK